MADHEPGRTRGDLRATGRYLGRFQWQGLLQFGPFRWGDVAPWRAVRVAVGVVAPLLVGAASGHVDYGAFASLGALPAGFASFQGVTRTRVAAVAAASVGMAVSAFVGSTTAAAAPWLLVLVVIVWGYVTGLAVCMGPRLSVAVLQWPVALLIAVGVPLGPTQAALRAGLVLAGGLFQGVLVTVSWALRRGDPERAALAASYRSLAAYANELAAGPVGPPPPTAFPAADRLADPNPLLPQVVRLAYLDLLEQAERVRACLAALAEHAADDPAQAAASRFAADAAQGLEAIAGALTARRPDRATRVRTLDGLVASLEMPSGTDWHWVAEALLGQLRAVTRVLAYLDTVPSAGTAGDALSAHVAPAQELGKWTALTLRANLTPAGEAGRHAVRLAVVAGLAEVIVLATGLFEGRWIVLTIFLVLKPDYNSTVHRSIYRAVGTAVGAGLGAAAALLAHSATEGLVSAAAIAVAAAYALFDVNYLLFSTSLTVYIVVLLEILGFPAATTATSRLICTAIGAVLALVAYAVWPTWEGLTAQEKFARLMEAHGQYATALLDECAHPGQVTSARLRGLQAAARRARTEAEASTARLTDEPPNPPLTPAVARTLVAAVTRLAHAELSLHALVTTPAPAPGKEGSRSTDADTKRLDALGTAFGIAMTSLAEAVRSLRPPDGLPSLRQLQAAVRDQSPTPDSRLVHITDGMVNAVDTLEAVLRRDPTPP
ncbi:FUSC family protein [Streptantibioticus ferralitis]|uniref:FUSC family protein n=1 Tax=Streptantibioticus ferralitis TaxID=236510 RepID=A0ABT5YVJ0_9ACTN|nr:FUSC family protein [Streptantibioticus ferralitis]MDF2255545.1 FUSC family protein [Streptantibioticus ferralitis]